MSARDEAAELWVTRGSLYHISSDRAPRTSPSMANDRERQTFNFNTYPVFGRRRTLSPTYLCPALTHSRY